MPDLALGTKFTTTGSKEVIASLNAIRSSLLNVSKSIDTARKQLRGLSIAVSNVARSTAEAGAKIQSTSRSFQDLGKSARAAATGTAAAGKSISGVSKSFQGLDKAAASSSKGIGDAGKAVDNMGKNAKGAMSQLANLGKTMQGLNREMAALGEAGSFIKGIGNTMLSGAVFPISEAADFEQGMQNVRAIMLDISENEFQMMTDKAKEMGETTAATAVEASEALNFLAMAGLRAAEATAALPSVLALAESGNLSMANAADIATNVMSGLGKGVGELEHIIDSMAVTASNSNQNIQELGRAMSVAGPAAVGAGESMKDMMSVLGGLAGAGIKGSQAGNSIKRMLISLISPTDRAKAALLDMGITTTDMEGNFKGLIPILKEMKDKNLDLAKANEIFGKYAAVAAIAASNQTAKIAELGGKLDSVAGAAKKMAAARLDTFWGQVKLLSSALKSLMIDAATPLLDILSAAVKVFTTVVRTLKNVMSALGPVGPILIGIAGTLGLILSALGAATVAAGGLLVGLTAISTLMSGQLFTSITLVTKGIFASSTAMQAAGASLVKLKAVISTFLPALAALAAAWGVVKIYEAAKAFLSMRDAQNEAKESTKNLVENSNRLIEKYKEFGQMDFSKKTTAELALMGKELQKARLYWLAMLNVAESTGDVEGIEKAKSMVNGLGEALNNIPKGNILQGQAEAVRATSEELKKFRDTADEAYAGAIQDAKEYADTVIKLADKIRNANLTTEQKVAEFRRKGLSESEKNLSRQTELENTLAKAKEAASQKDFEMSERLYKHAESLQVEIMGTQKTVSESQIAEYENIRAAYVSNVLEPQKAAAQDVVKNATATAAAIKQQIDALDRDIEFGVKINSDDLAAMQSQLDKMIYSPKFDFSTTVFENLQGQISKYDVKIPVSTEDEAFRQNLGALASKEEIYKTIGGKPASVPVDADDEEAKAQIAELTKTETKTIIVKTQTQEAKSGGGFAGEFTEKMKFAMGRILPGYGGGDRIDALLERGEAVIPKKKVREYGRPFIQSLIDGTFRMPKLKLAAGAIVGSTPMPAVSSGPDLKDFGTFTIRTKNGEYPMMTRNDTLKNLQKDAHWADLMGSTI
jgi:TP901 family phage tail tape measure protein